MTFDKKVILIVDDNEVNVRMAKNLLENKLNCRVITESNGLDGIRALERNPVIHLIILDIKMPLMNGIETLKKIRSNTKFKDTKVLMFTAAADRNTVIKAAELGISGYIKKPFNSDDLICHVQDCLF